MSPHSSSTSKYYSSAATRVLVVTSLLWATGTAFSQTAENKPASPWDVSVGLGVVSLAEYEGASKRISGIAPDLNISYKTEKWGTFGLGSKSRGISWTAIDTDAYSLGLSLGAGQGRVDNKDGTLLRPGSKRLKGMGEIKAAAEYGVFGHVTVGVPLTFAFIKDAGNGKVNTKDGSIDGSGGSRIELGAEIPWQLSNNLTLSFSPNLVWADRKHNQTYFGVTAAQSAKSGFKTYTADAGIKSLGLDIGADYKIDKNWSANAGLSLSQLRGDAAKSPLVQKKAQSLFTVGATYTF